MHLANSLGVLSELYSSIYLKINISLKAVLDWGTQRNGIQNEVLSGELCKNRILPAHRQNFPGLCVQGHISRFLCSST